MIILINIDGLHFSAIETLLGRLYLRWNVVVSARYQMHGQ